MKTKLLKIQLLLFAFGWAVVCSARSVRIVSDGSDFSDRLLRAVQSVDTVALDGSQGEFVLGHTVVCKNLKNKTILGINKAQLRTRFQMTETIASALDSLGIRGMSTAGEGGVLSNGVKVREEREWRTRQYLIDLFDDQQETFRSAGGLQLSYCTNITVRGLMLQGPGSVDVGGNDLIGIDHSTRIHIDSCDLRDGLDGNMDIVFQSDSVTVTNCTFGYTALSYDHMNSNLIGAGDRFDEDRGKLHVTYSDCTWLEGCRQRMPMVRFGVVRLVRCKWLCHTSYPVVDVRKEAHVTIEDGFFGEGVQIPYRIDPTATCEIVRNVE